MNKYNLNKKGNTESIIKIHLFDENVLINTNEFIKAYKVSNFFKGRFFLKRLIKKVFKYKIKKKIFWKKYFWEKVQISIVLAEIQLHQSLEQKISLEDFITSTYSKKRVRDIYFYKSLIQKNNKLDYPLFIDSQSLNLLGANENNNELYMLDGSRRIIASLLCGIKKQKIYLISIK